MSLSSVCVVMNALRLNFVKLRKRSNTGNNEIKKEIANPTSDPKENEQMKTTVMIIEGMMCQHCQGRVKAALEGVEGVVNVDVSLENASAEVKHDDGVSAEKLKSAVLNAGYVVTSIE